ASGRSKHRPGPMSAPPPRAAAPSRHAQARTARRESLRIVEALEQGARRRETIIKSASGHDHERLELQLRLDSLRDRACLVARSVRAHAQSPQVPAQEHLHARLQPRKLADDARAKRMRVLLRVERADLYVDERLLRRLFKDNALHF